MLSTSSLTDSKGRPYAVRRDGDEVVITIYPMPDAQFSEQSIINLRLRTKEALQLIHKITA
jgi:hypothetical protein